MLLLFLFFIVVFSLVAFAQALQFVDNQTHQDTPSVFNEAFGTTRLNETNIS